MATLTGGLFGGAQSGINNALGLNSATPVASDRIPFVWDSTLRELYRTDSSTKVQVFNDQNRRLRPFTATDRRLAAELAAGRLVDLTDAERARLSGRVTGGEIVSSGVPKQLEDLGYSLPPSATSPVEMLVNPNSIEWKQGKRYSEKKVRGGSVFYHFANKQGQANDILRLTFRGSTGNIDLRLDRTENGNSEGHGGLEKLMAFYSLYTMSREPETLPGGLKNRFTLSYVSPMFPAGSVEGRNGYSGGRAINFTGFFDSVINFTETAGKPNSRDYDFTFVVEAVDPSMEDYFNSLPLVLLQGGT